MTVLSVLHFNDVYRVGAQKLPSGTIDVTQFAGVLDDLRDQWPKNADNTRDGLLLFSGDIFSPSVESSVTRGSHMVPVMNELSPDVALTGNHDFDFGYPHLSKLVQDTKFPWILSNIMDTTTSHTPAFLKEFEIFERSGIRIGVIGLVEEDWISTVASWPAEFVYKSMKETGLQLSQKLRDPDGEYRCDFIIALTHSRIPNDILLAKDLLALSPEGNNKSKLASNHGVDIILGGHDHLYYVSKGVNSWEDYDINQDVLGAEEDNGNILVIKSGNDFRDISELNLEIEETPEGSVRRKIITKITGKRHIISSSSTSSETMSKILKTILSGVSSTLKAPVCKSAVVIDVRSQFIRTSESAAANWFADVIRHAYDDALCFKGCGGSDGVLICAGTLRGDSTYGPGIITLGDIMEILPFEDPVIVLEMDGATLWDAIEASLEKWPAQEGRFPVISGFRISWDSRRDPGQRLLGIWLLREGEDTHGSKESGTSTPYPAYLDEEVVKREKGGRKYKIVTRDYMAEGHDGFIALKDCKRLIDHEGGQLMSSIVRKYLLGSQFVNVMASSGNHNATNELNEKTRITIIREQHRQSRKGGREESPARKQWKEAIGKAILQVRSKKHYQNLLNVSATEHMSSVDCFDGTNARRGREMTTSSGKKDTDSLVVIAPMIDDRLKNEGQEQA